MLAEAETQFERVLGSSHVRTAILELSKLDRGDENETVQLFQLLYGRHFRVVFVGSTLFPLQQLSEINAVFYFSSTVFRRVGVSSNLANVFIGVANLTVRLRAAANYTVGDDAPPSEKFQSRLYSSVMTGEQLYRIVAHQLFVMYFDYLFAISVPAKSLPDLKLLGDTSLLSVLRWNFKTNVEKTMSSPSKGIISLIAAYLHYASGLVVVFGCNFILFLCSF
nr:probable plastidic glucose transporter 2 isoform X2 [Ipomoea trifida]